MGKREWEALSKRAVLVKELLKPVASENEIIGLEIGVWKGDFLWHLLEQMPRIKKLYGIDPWIMGTETVKPNWGNEEWEDICQRVAVAFKNKPQVCFVRGKSQDVIDQVPNDLHFIEIDGEHTVKQVLIDLEICWPKVQVGGLFCGHDYYGPYGGRVKVAVDHFAGKIGKKIFSKGEGPYEEGTWWWYK